MMVCHDSSIHSNGQGVCVTGTQTVFAGSYYVSMCTPMEATNNCMQQEQNSQQQQQQQQQQHTSKLCWYHSYVSNKTIYKA